MKKLIGYCFKTEEEGFRDAIAYSIDENKFAMTKQEVKEQIKKAKESGEIPLESKPTIFRVIVERV